MAESTAGIGEAGALVNRAKAPATMDITRGIQMAENNALKKAQLEAAKEAKKQAKIAAMDKYRTVRAGKYKNESVNKEAQTIARQMQYEMADAIDSGDMTKISELNQNIDFLDADLKVKDALLTSLRPNNKQVDTTEMYKAAAQGKLPEYLQTESPLIQKYFDQNEEGLPIVKRPENYNLNKAYDEIVARVPKEYIDMSPTSFGKIKLTQKVPAQVLRQSAATAVLNDAKLYQALDWNPEFRKVFKEEYGNNLEREEEAKVNFVYNNLTKYNEPKYQMGSQPKGGGTFKITGSGFSIGDYNFSTIPKTAADFVEELETNRTMFGRDEVQNRIIMERNKLGGNNPVTEVAMPANSSGTFIVSDPFIGKVNKGRPVSLMQGAGQTYLVYLTKRNNEDRTQIVQMTPEILSQMATYYKTDPATFIEAYGAGGVDLRNFAPSGNIKTKKDGGSAPSPAKAAGGKAVLPKVENPISKGGSVR